MRFLVIASMLLLGGCAAFFKGTHSEVQIDMPINTRIFDKDSNEVEVHHNSKGFHIELESNKKHGLYFFRDSLETYLELKPDISVTWVVIDVAFSPALLGYNLVHDYLSGGWNYFEDLTIREIDFVESGIDLQDFVKADQMKIDDDSFEYQKNVIYIDLMFYQPLYLYCYNYERALFRIDNSCAYLRIGLQANPLAVAGIPVQLNWIIGKKHQLEIGGGLQFDFYPENEKSMFIPKKVKPVFNIGYRYQPVQDGMVIRAGYSPLLKADDWTFESVNGKSLVFYFSFGYCF